MRFTMRDLTYLQSPLRQIAIALILGAVLGGLGPFGTFERLEWLPRLFYWELAVAAVWGCVTVTGVLLTRHPLVARLPCLRQAMLVALVAALPGAFLVQVLTVGIGLTVMAQLSYPLILGYVLLITMPSVVPITLMLTPQPVAAPMPPEPAVVPVAPPAAPAFHQRIPAGLGDGLLAVAAEDHYLRLHTDLGSDLILMRLSDALRELEGCDGLRVHRSWWVARAAVAQAVRDGQRARLILTNGLEVPVSRTYMPDLRQQGWL